MEISVKGYLEIVRQITDTLNKVIDVEREKIQAITVNDIKALDGAMKKEQALSMQLQGYENKRLKMHEGLGFGDFTFDEIADNYDGEDKLQLIGAFDALKRSLRMYKEISESAQMAMEVNISNIQMIMAERGYISEDIDLSKLVKNNNDDGNGRNFTDIKV